MVVAVESDVIESQGIAKRLSSFALGVLEEWAPIGFFLFGVLFFVMMALVMFMISVRIAAGLLGWAPLCA